jgi:hypothetical protein
MSTIAGYTILSAAGDRLRLVTIAERDDDAIDRVLRDRFGEIQLLSRMALDAKVLDQLNLHRGAWIEWTPLERPPRG